MLFQHCWLSSFLFIASATAHAYPPVGLKPRYLATGTGISLPSTGTAPYPTGTANGTAIATGSVTTSTATATPTPISPTELFYLVVANTGTIYDGQYLSVGSDTSGNGLLVLYPAPGPDEVTSFSTFNINADGTLKNEFSGGIASIFPGGTTGTPFFEGETYVEEAGNIESICEVVAGTLTCQTGADTVFFICPFQVISGTLVGGTVDVGETGRAGCTTITLLVVPL